MGSITLSKSESEKLPAIDRSSASGPDRCAGWARVTITLPRLTDVTSNVQPFSEMPSFSASCRFSLEIRFLRATDLSG